MTTHTACTLCGDNKIRKLKGYYEKGLMKCRGCGFVFMEKIPSPEELDLHYGSYSYESAGYLSPLTIKSYNSLLDEFEPYRKTNNILDVGCGRGWFLAQALKRGWKVYGTEYSKTAVRICQETGINIKEGVLDATNFDTEMFDVITSFEVIEHINNPNEELKEIYKLLRTGGLFYCTTPNFNCLMRYYLKADYNVIGYPEHLSYYTKSTLNKVTKRNGLHPIKFQSTGISITRLKTSKKKSNEQLISKNSSDEILRTQLESKWYLMLLKKFINFLLTLSNTGMTLKGYYIK